MNRQGILQVRVDRDLARDLDEQIKLAQGVDKTVTESVVVRYLLREVLAARKGRVIPVGEQAYKEGWLRGYGDAKHELQKPQSKTEPFERPPPKPAGSP